MSRVFNIEGVCVPSLHYMVDTSAKIDLIIREFVEPGKYFVINRARQYGKTTTLRLLEQKLSSEYLPIRISFEGKEGYFESRTHFRDGLCSQIARALQDKEPLLATAMSEKSNEPDEMDDLSVRITTMCMRTQRPIILMIDEVDRASDYLLFASFLGLLRGKYLLRADAGDHSTFHSVILAGVHDIKNLKAKIRQDSEHAYNSPWNIAATFDVDMSFSASDISTMLEKYETDYHTGMDIPAVADRIYEYTSGYPFLVSWLAKIVHDKELGWSLEGVDEAARLFLTAEITLFDDVIKNIRNNKDFGYMIERMILEGRTVDYNRDDPLINLGMMYGIFREDNGEVKISNHLFSTRVMNYFVSISETAMLARDRAIQDVTVYIHNGVLDFDKLLEGFTDFVHEQYRDKDGKFMHHEARRMLVGFIKPLANGRGNYFLEPEISGGRKIDLLVKYNRDEFIVEIKIWRGEAYEKQAYDQVAGYAKARRLPVGYLVTFCDLKKAPRKVKKFTHEGVNIHEYIIAYKDSGS